jgi:two-component system, sensor histidine kinase and response regulator
VAGLEASAGDVPQLPAEASNPAPLSAIRIRYPLSTIRYPLSAIRYPLSTMNVEDANKHTILIVDDVPANVRVLYEFLLKQGFKVRVAKDGKSAIKTTEHACPDLILLDIMMPGMDGFEVCQVMKSQESTREVPIIFMTALADTIDKIRGFSLGAVDYITKPFQQEEVLARVNAHLSLRKLQRELLEEIQQRKEAEITLQRHAVELEKRNLELDVFARTVAHDLKNPVNGIIGFTELLLEECTPEAPPSPESIEYLHWVVKAAQKMVTIIDSILLLAGVSKQAKVELQPLEMTQIVSQVQLRLAQLLREYHSDLKLPHSWPVAKGYAPWVEEIWANYISNALKYGGKPPRIELGADLLPPSPASPQAGRIRFWVRDNGPGLSKEAQAQLFTPFTRLHKDRAEGHGLGLSIVQQVVERLDGQVGVVSQEGRGSVFYFTLPAAG